MKIIDGQINIAASGQWGSAKIDSSLSRLLREMDSVGIERAVLTAIEPFSSNKFIAELINKHPERFYGFGHIRINHVEEDLKEILDLELSGIKIHPRIQKISIDEAKQARVFELAEKNQLAVKVCGWLQSSHVPIEDISILHYDRIAKDYPNIILIINHLGGHQFWDAMNVARSNQNVFLDCSYFLEFFDNTSLANDFFVMAEKMDRKLIYGSDFPEISVKDYYQKVSSKLSHLSSEKLENIFYKNMNGILKRNE